jgi:putative copper export protein
MHELEPLSLFIRWAHVVGMAAILGGALLVWALTARPTGADPEDRLRLRIAQRYEWIFWAAIGVQAMTGVGNLGAFGQGIPSASTAWGIRFTVKLVAVLVLALFSVPRTLAIATAARRSPSELGGASIRLPILYAATVILVLTIVALAVWLAHG